jgi:hypothetical protein
VDLQHDKQQAYRVRQLTPVKYFSLMIFNLLLGFFIFLVSVSASTSDSSPDELATVTVHKSSINRPASRLLELEESFKYGKLLSELPSATSADLKVQMANQVHVDFEKLSLPVLEMCLEYVTLPGKFGTLEKKREFLGKLFELGFRSGNRDEFAGSLKHTFCTEALKELGPVLAPNHLKWLNKTFHEILFDNCELLASLVDYSWITLDRFKAFMATRSSYVLNWMEIEAFLVTAPEDVLIEAMFYHFHPRMTDQVKALRPEVLTPGRFAADIRLFPVGVSARMTENVSDSKLICDDLTANGLTVYNLAAVLLYLQMTDFIVMHELNQVALAWCGAHEGFSADAEDSGEEDKNVRHARFNAAANPHSSMLLDIRKGREMLWETFQEISRCVLDISSRVPDWKAKLNLILRNPINLKLRLALVNLSFPALHGPIHPEEADAWIPLPRSIFAGPPLSIFVQASNPLLLNSVLRNVFFLNGESWREEALQESVDLASPEAVRTFLRNSMKLFYEHSTEAPLHSALMQIHCNFRLICRGIVATGPLAVQFLAENAVISVDPTEAAALTKIYMHGLTSIILGSFRESDLQHFEFIFRENQVLLNLIEGIRDDVQAKAENYPFHGEGFTLKHLQMSCLTLNKLDDEILKKIKTASTTGTSRLKFDFKEVSPGRLVQMISNLMLALGPKIRSSLLIQLWSNEEIFKTINLHPSVLSRSQIKSIFELDLARTFLAHSASMVAEMSDFSSFSAEVLQSLSAEVRDFRRSLASLPQDEATALFLRSDMQGFCCPARTAIIFGSQFWRLPEIRMHPQAWEAVDLLAVHADAFKRNFDFLGVLTEIVVKLPDLLEAAKPVILKWLIHMDWQFLLFHTMLQRASAGIPLSIHDTYRALFNEECANRLMLSTWLEEKGAEAEWIKLPQLTFSAFRAEIMAALKEGNAARRPSPYDALAIENGHIIRGAAAAFSAFEALPGVEAAWWDKLEVLQQIKSFKLTSTSKKANRLLNKLPVFEAAVYMENLKMFGVDPAKITNNSKLLKSTPPRYQPAIPV